jgi:outer membrane immunogenic protein
MQKLAIAAALTVVSLATLHGANAADMSARPMAYTPPPPPPPAFSWTGFYIGANAGGGSSHNDFNGTQTGSFTPTAFPGLAFPFTDSFAGSSDRGGGFAGGQIGFNYEFPFSHVVIGVEGDGDWANINGANNGCTTITSGAPVFTVGSTGGCATINSTLNSYETVRGRLGYAFDTGSYSFPSVLVYATGGGAWGRVNGNSTTTCVGPGCPGATIPIISGGTASFNNSTGTGWVAGAGFEWVFFQNWTFRFEYLHLQFPNESTNFTTTTVTGVAPGVLPGTNTATTHISSNLGVDVMRLGVNYLFNFGGPAYARY